MLCTWILFNLGPLSEALLQVNKKGKMIKVCMVYCGDIFQDKE